MNKNLINIIIVFAFFCITIGTKTQTITYPVVDTDEQAFFNSTSKVTAPSKGNAFYGQDASYKGNQPSYEDNGDGTITDNVTGLMWQKDPGEKITYEEAVNKAATFELAGYHDWRLPTIKELYSLILFSGTDPSGPLDAGAELKPFIDTDYFEFEYGDETAGERIIDSQFASSTLFVGDTEFGGGKLMFGVNFADGRIKGYPWEAMLGQTQAKTFFVLYVRGNAEYGKNDFIDNNDGTITDLATGLMWMKADSKTGMNWEGALSYAEELNYSGYSDWRLPNVKELQSIVDYERSPSTTNSAAIDPVFECSSITNEGGQADFPYFWSGTTHVKSNGMGDNGSYVSFGRALGYFNGKWMDVHGAGAQRSDPKTGNAANYPTGHGPQGDAIRILNYVRCVRDAGIQNTTGWQDAEDNITIFPNPVKEQFTIYSAKKLNNCEFTLTDLTGKVLIKYSHISFSEKTIQTNTLYSGIYIISIKVQDKYIIRKIVKE